MEFVNNKKNTKTTPKGGGSNARLTEVYQVAVCKSTTLVKDEGLFNRTFPTPNYEQFLFQLYQLCSQGKGFVYDYTMESNRLASRNKN